MNRINPHLKLIDIPIALAIALAAGYLVAPVMHAVVLIVRGQ